MANSLKFYFFPSFSIGRDGKAVVGKAMPAGKFFDSSDYELWDLLAKNKFVTNPFTDIIGMEPDSEIFELTDN
jgi:hypothetical protein